MTTELDEFSGRGKDETSDVVLPSTPTSISIGRAEDVESIKPTSFTEGPSSSSKTPAVGSELEILPDPPLEPPSEKPVTEIADYSVYTTNQKRAIVLTASLAGFFSPLSGSIYYPALDTIAKSLNVSNSAANLTVTTYMVCLLDPLLQSSSINLLQLRSYKDLLLCSRLDSVTMLGGDRLISCVSLST